MGFDERAKTWDASDRRQALASDVAGEILRKIDLRPDMRILDMGAGTGLLTERLLSILTQLSFSVVCEVINRIIENGDEPRLAAFVMELLAERKASPAVILWLLRNMEKAESWGHTDRAELLRQGFDAIEWPAAGDQLRAQHRIRELFESASWFTDR